MGLQVPMLDLSFYSGRKGDHAAKLLLVIEIPQSYALGCYCLNKCEGLWKEKVHLLRKGGSFSVSNCLC